MSSDYRRFTLPLDPQEEVKLVAAARASGLLTGALAREALERIFAEAAHPGSANEPTRSMRGLLAKYGLAIADTHTTRWYIFVLPRIGRAALVVVAILSRLLATAIPIVVIL